jgi:DNA-directed RNA polymerase specialized sigma24 family protein
MLGQNRQMQNFDREFIQKLKEKDNKAIEKLYRLTFASVYKYIFYRVDGDAELTEDILSEVYCAAIRYFSSLTLAHNVHHWLLHIAKTKIADHFRNLIKQRKIISRKINTFKLEELTMNQKFTPESALVIDENKLLIRAAFGKLPLVYQDALY